MIHQPRKVEAYQPVVAARAGEMQDMTALVKERGSLLADRDTEHHTERDRGRRYRAHVRSGQIASAKQRSWLRSNAPSSPSLLPQMAAQMAAVDCTCSQERWGIWQVAPTGRHTVR